jgi:ribosomal protein L37E
MSLQQQSSPETKMTTTCPECGSAMSISAVAPTMFGNLHENITYSCRKCGKMRTYTVDTSGVA